MKAIKNIIFDLGGVVYDIRYENVTEAIKRHGAKDLGTFYSKDYQTEEMNLFEKGLISVADYRNHIREITGLTLSDADVDDIVNAILIDIPKERVDLLLRLKRRYGVYLYSNTNQINYDCFTQRMKEKYGFDIFAECFHAAYFSHQMHLRKPSKEGFEIIMKEQGLSGDETVFIDDIEKNLEGARQAGLRGYHLSEGSIVDLFDADGNPCEALQNSH